MKNMMNLTSPIQNKTVLSPQKNYYPQLPLEKIPNQLNNFKNFKKANYPEDHEKMGILSNGMEFELTSDILEDLIVETPSEQIIESRNDSVTHSFEEEEEKENYQKKRKREDEEEISCRRSVSQEGPFPLGFQMKGKNFKDVWTREDIKNW